MNAPIINMNGKKSGSVWRLLDIAVDHVKNGGNVLFLSSKLDEKEIAKRLKSKLNTNDDNGFIYVQTVNEQYTPDYLMNVIYGVEFQLNEKIDIIIFDDIMQVTLYSNIANQYLKFSIINERLCDITYKNDVVMYFPSINC